MKQFNSILPSLRCKTSILVALCLLGLYQAATAQVYRANKLLGSSEAVPNSSPGTGSAIVTIAGTTMRVQATFSGLTANTVASHIHAATAVAGVGTAGVATSTPSFPGFPLGVKAGTFDMTFNMNLASSYNASFIVANGGTIVAAFAALKTALNNGTSYFNIHSTAFPGGEIRGFLVACPTITVSIPDAFALPQGTLANTVYPAYSAAASLMLITTVSGGAGPYTYNWSNGSSAATTTVSPVVTTQYGVSVQDQNGCTGTATKTVFVVDISSGKKGDKIDVCHKGTNTLSIAVAGVSAHLDHGDMLGSCPPDNANAVALRKFGNAEQVNRLSVQVLPNPSLTYFDFKISSKSGNNVQLKVVDLLGRTIETKRSVQPNQMLRLGAFYTPGIYIVEVVQGVEKQILKLIKEK